MYSINIYQFHFPLNKQKLFFHYEEAEWFPTGGDITIPWEWVSIWKCGGRAIFVIMEVGLLAFSE